VGAPGRADARAGGRERRGRRRHRELRVGGFDYFSPDSIAARSFYRIGATLEYAELTGTPLPTSGWGKAAAVSGNAVVVIGGRNDNMPNTSSLGSVASAQVMGTSLSAWTMQIGVAPTEAPALLAWGDRLVLAGGASVNTQMGIVADAFSSTVVGGVPGPWILISPLPLARRSACSFVVGGTGFVAGGQGTAQVLDQVVRYDLTNPNANWVTDKSLPSPLFEHACAVIAGRLYVIGGQQPSMQDASAEVWSVPVSSAGLGPEEWRPETSLPVGRRGAGAAVLPP